LRANRLKQAHHGQFAQPALDVSQMRAAAETGLRKAPLNETRRTRGPHLPLRHAGPECPVQSQVTSDRRLLSRPHVRDNHRNRLPQPGAPDRMTNPPPPFMHTTTLANPISADTPLPCPPGPDRLEAK
jgi:hypothetical protein